MRKKKPIKLDQILARRTRGYAFSGGTYAERVTFREQVEEEIATDFRFLTEDEFRKKYEPYIY